MSTQRSRGKETTNPAAACGSMCTTMIASDRWPPTSSAVPKSCCSPSVSTNARLSVPTTRKFCGPPGSGKSRASGRIGCTSMSLKLSSTSPFPNATATPAHATTATSAIAKRAKNERREVPGAKPWEFTDRPILRTVGSRGAGTVASDGPFARFGPGAPAHDAGLRGGARR